MEDGRAEKKLTHPLVNVVSIAILGVICGADGWVSIELYGKSKVDWLGSFLDLSNGIPSHDTFGRVFRWLDEEAFQTKFAEWTARICQATGGQVVAIDGKKLRRSHDGRHERDGIWMVSAWSSDNRMVLAQTKVAEKSNEITAIPQLLAQLDLSGCVHSIHKQQSLNKLSMLKPTTLWQSKAIKGHSMKTYNCCSRALKTSCINVIVKLFACTVKCGMIEA